MFITINQDLILLSPVHVFPSPSNPDLHVHVYPPSVSEHVAFSAQSAVSSLHSSISIHDSDDILMLLKKLILWNRVLLFLHSNTLLKIHQRKNFFLCLPT